jgi:hypothetical protein
VHGDQIHVASDEGGKEHLHRVEFIIAAGQIICPKSVSTIKW